MVTSRNWHTAFLHGAGALKIIKFSYQEILKFQNLLRLTCCRWKDIQFALDVRLAWEYFSRHIWLKDANWKKHFMHILLFGTSAQFTEQCGAIPRLNEFSKPTAKIFLSKPSIIVKPPGSWWYSSQIQYNHRQFVSNHAGSFTHRQFIFSVISWVFS